MAQLTEVERRQIWRGLMRYWSGQQVGCPFMKADLKAAVDALDVFLNNNAVVINNTLPEPFKTVASIEQKAVLLAGVVLRRYNVEALKRVFGEVD